MSLYEEIDLWQSLAELSGQKPYVAISRVKHGGLQPLVFAVPTCRVTCFLIYTFK